MKSALQLPSRIRLMIATLFGLFILLTFTSTLHAGPQLGPDSRQGDRFMKIPGDSPTLDAGLSR